MRNVQRILALGAMALTTGAVLGMTATAASASTEAATHATAAQPGPHDGDGDWRGSGNGDGDWHGRGDGDWHGRHDHDRTWIAGRYDTRKACQFFAWIGETRGRFDEGRCVPAFNGRHGQWLLIAKDYGHRGHR